MRKFTGSLRFWVHASFVVDQSGATAVEYGIMLALIAAVITGVVTLLGLDVHNAFCSVLPAFGHTC